MSGDGGDRTFTPDYPGLTDADDISGWEPPFPVDLKRVRKQDEDYWDQWRGAPKAFVPLDVAQRLWATAHGRVSSVRIPVPEGEDPSAFATRIESTVRQQLDPTTAGFEIRDARAEALAAAEGTTDFGEYFFYFSFFLVVAGLLLAALFFTLGVEQRSHEIGLLSAAGFARRDIVRVFASQAAVLALLGSAFGIAGAIGYAALIMYGLRTWWSGAVGTTALTLHVNWPLLAAGVGAALLAATAALVMALRGALRRTPRALLSGAPDPRAGRRVTSPRRSLVVAAASAAFALALLIATRAGLVAQVAGFFAAGGTLMIAGLVSFSWWLRRPHARVVPAGVARFGADYARWRPTRSVLSAALITFACFVIVSVGAFRRDPSGMSLDRRLGTGGFVLMAESVAPLMHDPNTETGRQEYGLDANPVWDTTHIARFRLKTGDDASCLSLYQPRNPRIVAPEDAFVADARFSFAHSLASTPAEHANPWLLLAKRFDDGAIPAIADQTSLAYVFHLKVGDDYVFQTDGGRVTRFRIVGALADSVLQSELVISEDAFVTLFPRREGYGLWMIDAPPDTAGTLSTILEDRLSDYGVDVTETRARLAAYHRVENTYLSTFQALGALGLLVGTLGIAAVLARNVLERRRELALLRAVGFTPRHLRTLVISESLLLVGVGLLLGSSTAVFAVLPAVLERSGAVPFRSVALLLLAVTITGLISSILAARMATATSLVSALKSE
jgi:ABC-type lipoprotein release transport system permease subunit